MSKYTTTYTRTDQVKVTVVVDDADDEAGAQDLADTYFDWPAGMYAQLGIAGAVTVSEDIEDSDMDWNEDGEWEGDDDDVSA